MRITRNSTVPVVWKGRNNYFGRLMHDKLVHLVFVTTTNKILLYSLVCTLHMHKKSLNCISTNENILFAVVCQHAALHPYTNEWQIFTKRNPASRGSSPFVIFFRGRFWPSGIVVACVCLCVRPSVRPCVNHELVRAITHHPFKLGSPSLDHRCKRPWLRSLLFLGWLTLTFKVTFNFKVKIYPILSLSMP